MVTLDGDVKILDFGLAKRMGSAGAPAQPAGAVEPGGTQGGAVMGTPGYMSPEQILGEELDPRSDVFSFGVTLYEMVTGAPPFDGNVRQRIFDTLEGEPTPPAQLGRRVSPALDRLIMKCLTRRRDDRVASMRHVVRELSQIAAEMFGAGASRPERASLPTLDVPSGALSRRALPSGSVTLLVAVVAEASVLLERHGEAYPDILARYHALAAGAAERAGGTIVSAAAEQVVAVFTDPRRALDAAVDAQRGFHAERWPGGAAVRVRVGLHTGEPRLTGDQYSGLDVHRAMRIAESAAGGQVALSAAARKGLAEGAIGGLALRDLGAIRIKDLHYPEHLFSLSIEGLGAHRVTRGIPRGRSRLPEQPTAFIGRTRLIADVTALLGRDDVRLVTLTGPGGTGKTRLSIEVARAVEPRFPNGVVQVRLGAVTDPALVLPTIARALDLPEVPGTQPLEVIANGVGGGALLLVLDNFEQIVEAAPAVADLLAACGGLKVLVTSREVLRVRGEREVGVPPLELPAGGADFEAVAASEAVRMFVDRARDLSPAFALTPGNAPLVVAICARLDAIPLAIELAASRTRMLSLDALHRRLGDRLGFVKATERDREQRHRTLRATIDWSHDLLDEPSRILFRRVSVFRGGFSLESAEAVCGAEELDVDVFEGLSSLVGKSLLRLYEVDGAPRMGALETIREYAQERLRESADEAPMRARHAEHFAAFVEERASGVLGRDWRQSVGPLLTEIDNVPRGALLRARAAHGGAHGPHARGAPGVLADLWPHRGGRRVRGPGARADPGARRDGGARRGARGGELAPYALGRRPGRDGPQHRGHGRLEGARPRGRGRPHEDPRGGHHGDHRLLP